MRLENVLDIMGDLMLYASFKCVRKFNFCVSPLVKRYPGQTGQGDVLYTPKIVHL